MGVGGGWVSGFELLNFSRIGLGLDWDCIGNGWDGWTSERKSVISDKSCAKNSRAHLETQD